MITNHKIEQLKQTITLLADGNWHKGPELASKLDVSRAYVWKLLQELQEFGLSFESVSGKGYRLTQALQLLDQESLQQQLAEIEVEPHLQLLTDSTNLQLKEQGFAHQKLVIAEYQSQGRGRRGRSWVSPIASNLYWSYGWRTQMPVQQLGGLSLIVGLALVEALENNGLNDLTLKWPNDLRYHGKKVGGILVELSGDASGDLKVIIGVGVNVQMEQTLGESIEQDWTSISEVCRAQALEPISRQQLLVAMVKQLQQNLSKFESEGFSPFVDAWKKVDESFGQAVTILQPEQELKGVGAGVDANGAFLLQTQEQLETIYAGEVSLRIST